MATARIKPLPWKGSGDVHCGRCGQRLWVADEDADGYPALSPAYIIGSRWNRDLSRLEPTKGLLAARHAAHRRIRAGRARVWDQDWLSQRDGYDGQGGRRGLRLNQGWIDSAECIQALRLPTKIVCSRCKEENVVTLDTVG
jgi:hypothetical protein